MWGKATVIGVAVTSLAAMVPSVAAAESQASASPSWQVTSTAIEAPPHYAVGCANAEFCVAANGHSWLMWDGHGWWGMPGPVTLTDQTFYSPVRSVCLGATWCMTVGNTYTNSTSTWSIYASLWNGQRWSDLSLPSLPGTPYLWDLSCPSTTRCYAAGNDKQRQLVLSWDGTTWSADSALPATPTEATDSDLTSISCWAPQHCIALGTWSDSQNGDNAQVAYRLNGTNWSAITPPAVTTPHMYVYRLSCPSATFCLAVGQGQPQAWDGSGWSILPPLPSAAGTLDCAAVNDCMVDVPGNDTESKSQDVTGQYTIQVQNLGSMVHFDGSTFTVLPRPDAETQEQGLLYSLDCTSTNYCLATGLRPDNLGHAVMFAEQYA